MPITTVNNAGDRDQVVKVRGGTITVRSGTSRDVEDLIEMDDGRIAHYKARGVTFADPGKKSGTKRSTRADAKAKAAEDMATAQAAVDAAKVAVDAAGDDLDKKASAAKALEDAEEALAALSTDDN
jgi:hypothetical protein